MSSNPETVTDAVETETLEETGVELTAEQHGEESAPVSLNAVVLDAARVKNIVEAALMAAGQPLSVDRLLNLFLDESQPSRDELRTALTTLAEECESRGIELVEVGSGFRYQAKQENAQWIARLWEEKPARYSRALLETLALIAYRQPITRGEIEDIRGVSVSTNIMKTLMERDWVKVVGHRDVPGKPAMYASTKQFLDYFSLKGLSDLPALAEIRDIDSINAELDLAEPDSEHADASVESNIENNAEVATDDTQDVASVEMSEATDDTVTEQPEVDGTVLSVADDEDMMDEPNNAEQDTAVAADPA
jgi:segregation and condensation protein B